MNSIAMVRHDCAVSHAFLRNSCSIFDVRLCERPNRTARAWRRRVQTCNAAEEELGCYSGTRTWVRAPARRSSAGRSSERRRWRSWPGPRRRAGREPAPAPVLGRSKLRVERENYHPPAAPAGSPSTDSSFTPGVNGNPSTWGQRDGAVCAALADARRGVPVRGRRRGALARWSGSADWKRGVALRRRIAVLAARAPGRYGCRGRVTIFTEDFILDSSLVLSRLLVRNTRRIADMVFGKSDGTRCLRLLQPLKCSLQNAAIFPVSAASFLRTNSFTASPGFRRARRSPRIRGRRDARDHSFDFVRIPVEAGHQDQSLCIDNIRVALASITDDRSKIRRASSRRVSPGRCQ